MRTLTEALETQGTYLYEDGLELWFSPLPNWYIYKHVDCPRCEQEITWQWAGTLPDITTPQSIRGSGVLPVVSGAVLKNWGHRYLELQCQNCATSLYLHNFDERL